MLVTLVSLVTLVTLTTCAVGGKVATGKPHGCHHGPQKNGRNANQKNGLADHIIHGPNIIGGLIIIGDITLTRTTVFLLALILMLLLFPMLMLFPPGRLPEPGLLPEPGRFPSPTPGFRPSEGRFDGLALDALPVLPSPLLLELDLSETLFPDWLRPPPLPTALSDAEGVPSRLCLAALVDRSDVAGAVFTLLFASRWAPPLIEFLCDGCAAVP